MSQVGDEIFIDVHKLLMMCIVLKALHTINACFSGKHASRTCRLNHSSCISKNRPFSETKNFRRISFCQDRVLSIEGEGVWVERNICFFYADVIKLCYNCCLS